MALTAMAIKNAKPKSKPYKLSDGGGLYLLVNPSGSRLWRMDYRFGGKYKTLALGIHPHVSLSEARKTRDEAKLLLKADTDPAEVRKHCKRQEVRSSNNSFESIAAEWFENKKDGWKTSYSERIYRRLQLHVFPELGERAIDTIEPLELLETLRKVEAQGLGETPGRLLQLCGSIFRYAVITKKAKIDPTPSLKGALKPRPRPQHRAALTAHELPIFLKTLDQYCGNPQTRLAILFVLHTFVRTAEARLAEWKEFEGLTVQNRCGGFLHIE